MGLVRRFIDWNVRTSRRVDQRVNPDHGDLHRAFLASVEEEMARLKPDSTVLDLGGGRRFQYKDCLPPGRPLRLVAVDISEEELAENTDVAETRVANVAEGLPFEDGEANLVLSHFLLEHVDGVPAAIAHMGRVLAPGGVALHFIPCRYSTFGIGARLLPFGPLLKLVHFLLPHSKGEVEFEVRYDHCYPAALEKAFRDAGFSSVEVRVEYHSTGYYMPLFPVYLLVAAYEWLVGRADARSLCAYMMVHATR